MRFPSAGDKLTSCYQRHFQLPLACLQVAPCSLRPLVLMPRGGLHQVQGALAVPYFAAGVGFDTDPPLTSLLSALGTFWQSMLSSHDQQDLHHIITLHHHIHEVQYRWPSSRTTLLPVFVSTERLEGGCIGILGSSPPPDPFVHHLAMPQDFRFSCTLRSL